MGRDLFRWHPSWMAVYVACALVLAALIPLAKPQDSKPNEEHHPLRMSFPRANDKKPNGRWVVVAGRQVVPGSIYKVAVEALTNTHDEGRPLTVRAALQHNYEQVSFAKVSIQPGELSQLLLKVPDASVGGKWHLTVEGREGASQMVVFKNTTELSFNPEFLTILIQTSRPVYNAGQTVRFRAIMLTRELKPYDEPVDVYILDPQGRIMRRWPSRQTGDGVVNLSFTLPQFPLTGGWKIRVVARSQVEEKIALVEQYFKPRFEVFVRLPHTFMSTDEFVEGVVIANMTNWRNVYGNCTLRLQYARHSLGEMPANFKDVYSIFVPSFKGVYPFQLPMDAVVQEVGGNHESLKGVTVKVLATVGDSFGWRIQEGWAMARLVVVKAKLTFLGDEPLIFRPGMPVSVHLFASYDDDHPLEKEELELAKLQITFKASGGTGKILQQEIDGFRLMEDGGVAKATFEAPKDAQSIRVDASFSSTNDRLTASATFIGIAHHSPLQRHLQVETSSSDVSPGEFVVFHVRNNFFTDHFNYVIVSRGGILHSGREPVTDVNVPTVTTFTIPASTEMAPVCNMLVWVVAQDGQLVSHSISVPINPLGRHKVGIRWNDHKDHTGGSAELKMLGEKGSFFGVSAVWEETHMMNSNHDLDAARVLYHMMGFGKSTAPSNETVPNLRRAATRSRKGEGAKVTFYPTPAAGPDSPTTFNLSDLVLLTDAVLYYHPSHSSDFPQCESEELQCMTGGCFSPQERCNGKYECADRSDEAGCPIDIDPLQELRLYRQSRLHRFYDSDDGDWAWKDLRKEGGEIAVFSIPKRPQAWVLSMFAVGKQLGLGILEEKIKFDSAGPFCLNLEGPSVARMWEQVGLRVAVFNFHSSVVGALITLPKSPDYKTIVMDKTGAIPSYKPKTTNGELQHIVWLQPGEHRDVHIPIVFTRLGSVEVTVKGSTQMQKDSHTIVIDVQREGASINQHTSVLLDLKNRGQVFQFLDIHLDETPIIPYSLRRRYIYGTPSGHVSVTGDVVGPLMPEVPMVESRMLDMEVTGAEGIAYNFASNVLGLHYLRLTNQLTSEIKYEVLSAANVQYAAIARYQNDNGAFRMWLGSEETVWLTAYVLRILWIANFQDWENLIYIDPAIIQRGVEYLLDFQTPEGAFSETPHYLHPLDPKVDPRSRHSWLRSSYRNVSLTAHVVLTLADVIPNLDNHLRSRTNLVKSRAVRYLERELEALDDPYDIAIVSWALTKADSEKREYAFNKLDRHKRENGNKIYWSREPVNFNQIIYEDSQKPFIQPKDDQKWDAHAVETTAYALLVYVAREGIGIIQENIVRFLAAMRKLDDRLIATLDSIVALDALVQYSYTARLRDITNMHIIVDHSADPNFTANVHFDNKGNLAEMKSFDLKNIWGHLSVTGHGSGQALVQLNYAYGVDYDPMLNVPPVPAFDFTVRANFSGRNHSHVTITSCQRWINKQEAEVSGLTVVDIYLPSGYHIMQDELIDLVNSRSVRNLRWAVRTPTKVKFFLNRLDAKPTCFSYKVERWHPVSNHSRYNLAIVYELYQPERFQETIFEVYPLFDLDICEVCGSYQCPYCPYYNSAHQYSPSCTFTLFLLVVLYCCWLGSPEASLFVTSHEGLKSFVDTFCS